MSVSDRFALHAIVFFLNISLPFSFLHTKHFESVQRPFSFVDCILLRANTKVLHCVPAAKREFLGRFRIVLLRINLSYFCLPIVFGFPNLLLFTDFINRTHSCVSPARNFLGRFCRLFFEPACSCCWRTI